MQFLKNDIFSKQRSLLIIFVVTLLIASNSIFGLYTVEFSLDAIYFSDDPQHINVANNFRKTGQFEISLATINFFQSGTDTKSLMQNYPEIPYPEPRVPLYYLFLGSFFKVLETEPKDLHIHASIFNNLLTSRAIPLTRACGAPLTFDRTLVTPHLDIGKPQPVLFQLHRFREGRRIGDSHSVGQATPILTRSKPFNDLHRFS